MSTVKAAALLPAWLSASRKSAALLMSISPAAASTVFPWLSCLVDSLSGLFTADPYVHGDGGAVLAGDDADVVHHRLHQREALAPVRGGLGPGWQPAAAVGDGQLEAVGGDGGPQCDLVAGAVSVAVLARVGNGFPGCDEGVLFQL